MKKAGKPRAARNRPQLIRPSNEMKEWSVRLGDELATWPRVEMRPMFGMLAYYRGAGIFAALPRTRTVETPNSFMYKLPGSLRPTKKTVGPGADWRTFEIHSAGDLRAALAMLGRAYEAAAAAARRKKR